MSSILMSQTSTIEHQDIKAKQEEKKDKKIEKKETANKPCMKKIQQHIDDRIKHK